MIKLVLLVMMYVSNHETTLTLKVWNDSIFIEIKIHVFVWIQVWGFIISYRSYIGNSYRAYLELVTVHIRIIAFVVTVYLQCSYRVTLRNFAPFIQSYTNASNDINIIP